jgi:hypothetical protein
MGTAPSLRSCTFPCGRAIGLMLRDSCASAHTAHEANSNETGVRTRNMVYLEHEKVQEPPPLDTTLVEKLVLLDRVMVLVWLD